MYDDEDTSHLGSSAVGSSAQRQRGSMHYAQDIRMRVLSPSSRSRSTSTQRMGAEEEVPNGETSAANLPPRSRLRQTTTNERKGKGRGERDSEEKDGAFTGFDELDAIAAAKPQEEILKGQSSPTITRSNTALPRKKQRRGDTMVEQAVLDTGRISVEAGRDEGIPEGWALPEPEPVPRSRGPRSKQTAGKSAPRNYSVPLSNAHTASDLGRPAHWGSSSRAPAAPAGGSTRVHGKKGRRAQPGLQQRSPPTRAARTSASSSLPAEATDRELDTREGLDSSNPSFRQRWGVRRAASRGTGRGGDKEGAKQEFVSAQRVSEPHREDIEEAGEGDRQEGGLPQQGNTVGGDSHPGTVSSQTLPLSAQKQPSSFLGQSPSLSTFSYGGDRSSPPNAYTRSRKRGNWPGVTPQSLRRKAVERVHKAMKTNQTMFMLRAHDENKGVDLANPRNRARVTVSILVLRRESAVTSPFAGFLVRILPDGVKPNKHLLEKREYSGDHVASSPRTDADTALEKVEADAALGVVPHISPPTVALQGSFAFALFRENHGSSSSCGGKQPPVEGSLCTIYDPVLTWLSVAGDNYCHGCQYWRGLPELPVQPPGMPWGVSEAMRFPVLVNTYLTDCTIPSSREELEAAVGGARGLARAQELASQWPRF